MNSLSDYRNHLKAQAALPEGFQAGTAALEFVPAEYPGAGAQPMNLALIRLNRPTDSFAAVFTRNAFPGWPVIEGRRLLNEAEIQSVLVNNKVSNVGCEGGLHTSRRLARHCSDFFGDLAPCLPSSTGVIGWSLPEQAMRAAFPQLKNNLQSETLLPFAESIMTTDAWPKLRSESCGAGRITAAAKGAGMIEPDMATMLAFFLTDIDLSRDFCRQVIAEVAEETFNRISVDGETSTSDTVVLLSSRTRPFPGSGVFRDALMSAASLLADDVVRNGEGVSHVFRVTVSGAPDRQTAVYLARSVANAPLTKTAVCGNDPNIGRILQAFGAACGRRGIGIDSQNLLLTIGSRPVYRNGHFYLNAEEEAELSQYLKERELPLPSPGWPVHQKNADISIQIRAGEHSATVTGAGLSEEYVKINADYRT